MAKKKKPRGSWGASVGRRLAGSDDDAAVDAPAASASSAPVVIAAPTVGQAIESVRVALEPFNAATRVKIFKASLLMLK